MSNDVEFENEVDVNQEIPETENYSEYDVSEDDSNLPAPADYPEEDSSDILGKLIVLGGGVLAGITGVYAFKHKDDIIKTSKAYLSPDKETRKKLKKEIKQEKAWRKAQKAGLDPETYTNMCIAKEAKKPDPEPVSEESTDKNSKKK